MHWFGQVHLSITASKENVVVFLHLIAIILSYAIIRRRTLLYWNLQKKTDIQFSSKKFLQKYLFKIPLWREIDNVTTYFLISGKNMK